MAGDGDYGGCDGGHGHGDPVYAVYSGQLCLG